MEINAKILWLQTGLINIEATTHAKKNRLIVFEYICIRSTQKTFLNNLESEINANNSKSY